jgi:hypothetical protein
MMGQDGFRVAEPFSGIPWMEAIFVRNVYGTKNNFVSYLCIDSPEDYKMERLEVMRRRILSKSI